jgi:pyruvate/2-oxoglutarate dehydrogenase complex dihydrolipoamide dehydrogenase (E3) component
VSSEDLAEFTPDVVIVATGGTPLVPRVPGIEQENVVTGLDVLRGVAEVGPRALVVGGLDNHIGAPTIAEFLADQGKEVELISEHLDFANGAEDGTRFPLMQHLMTKGVKVSLLHKLASLADSRATVMQTFTREERHVEDVTVVLACGLVPNEHLARELTGKVGEVHLIGDALAPRRVMQATLEGARTAQAL